MAAELPHLTKLMLLGQLASWPAHLATWSADELDQLKAEVMRFHNVTCAGIVEASRERRMQEDFHPEIVQFVRDEAVGEVMTFCAYAEGCIELALGKLEGKR